MTKQKFDDRLLKILEGEVLKEKWKKKLRIAGVVTGKRISKKGSFVFTIKTKKSEYDIVVSQHRKDEFNLAQNINESDIIKVIGNKQASGIVFCERIKKISKSNFDENQMKIVL